MPPRLLHTCQTCRAQSIVQQALRRAYSTPPARPPLQLAIIGSGPAGFYSAYRLLKKLPDAQITMFEQLPVPYGLARYGVAPDHPEVKKCTETLETVARESPTNFNFCGNTPIGTGPGSLPLTTLAPHFDAILFAYGAGKDKQLGIPGEGLTNIISARAFVGWYNGLPEYADLHPDLQAGETAVIIGQGNVALDVTRTLLSPLDELRKTDINEETISALSESKIRDVKVIGRRGPLQAPYTIKELRELMHLFDVGFAPPPESWDDLLQAPLKKLPRQLKRIAELLQKGSKSSVQDSSKAWQLGFLRSPAAFLSSDSTTLQAVGFEQMEYERPLSELLSGDAQTDLNNLRAAKVKPTGRKTSVRAELAFRSVGYLSEALEGMQEIGVPFDSVRGVVPNDRWGRVIAPATGEQSTGFPGEAYAESEGRRTGASDEKVRRTDPGISPEAHHVAGMYCAGWVKRGPTGVIASTLDDAFITADAIAHDWESGSPFANHNNESGGRGGWETLRREVEARGIRHVSWQEWEKIDAVEKERGRERGKIREKIRRVDEMLQVIDS
ncbi:NADPH-adrenodoxin reductase [Recurvomyces mirabilis]|nr:NADPH-adrenodoxin reductase [Recurvomyces mirabilis]